MHQMPKLFTTDHEWIEQEGGVATVGITAHAQEQLGDIVFVELPKVGQKVTKGEAAGVVESVKAASDIYAPVSGEVVAINDAVASEPAQINAGAEGKGWLFKVKLADTAELSALLDAAAYAKLIG
jgi:glycine cleavage system H protein